MIQDMYPKIEFYSFCHYILVPAAKKTSEKEAEIEDHPLRDPSYPSLPSYVHEKKTHLRLISHHDVAVDVREK